MKIYLVFIFMLLVLSCIQENPNLASEETIQSQSLIDATVLKDSTIERRKVYVPIYSDIYQKSRSERTMLTATLSIRNTSEFDSIYLGRVDYFNTTGDLVKKCLPDTVFLQPMETIDFVIAERDTLGGSGANFILEWYGKEHLSPVFQAVMIGGLGNKSFSFTTEGKEIME